MTNMTQHIVKARNLRKTDQIIILGNTFTITNLSITETAVFVSVESKDEIGTIKSEGLYQLDTPITVVIPAQV